MNLVGISFSSAPNSLQSRGLLLVNHFLQFQKLCGLGDFDIPLCNSNRPDGEVPQGVQDFDRVLSEADALVFAISEAGGHYSASFKNVMDWLIVMTRFNSQLGAGYSLSNKPVYILTFTPTHQDSGGRHFEMTKYILAEKFGARVRLMHVWNRCWEQVVPGNYEFVKDQSLAIRTDLESFAELRAKPQKFVTPRYDTEKWLQQYEAWDRQWTE